MQVTPRRLIRLILNLTVFAFLFLLAAGCSSSPLRCHDSMLRENSIKKIALFSEGDVMWIGVVEKHLDVSESLAALEAVHDATETELKQRGYEMVTSLPARVYKFNPQNVQQYRTHLDLNQNYSVYENYREDRHKKRELQWDTLVYEAPELKENEPLRGAVNRILTDIESASVMEEVETSLTSTPGVEAKIKSYISHLDEFNPSPEAVAVIREHVDAEAVCFAKAYRGRITPGLKQLSLDNENTAVLHICVDSSTGDVLWQRFTRKHWTIFNENLISDMVRKNLNRFPERGKPVTGECEL